MGFKLPQLGALFVANEKGQLVDEKDQLVDEKGQLTNEKGQPVDEKGQRVDEKGRAVLLESGAEYKALLKKYAELPHDGIALIVANAFMRAEHREFHAYEQDAEAEAEHHELDKYSKLGAVFNLCAC